MVIKPTDPAILSPEWLWDKLDWEMCLNDAWGRGEVGRIINSCVKLNSQKNMVSGSSEYAAIDLQKVMQRLHNQHGPPFEMIYRMVVMPMCSSNLGSPAEHWFPKKEPVDRWTWRSDALGEPDQNTADRECETPMLFLKDKAKKKRRVWWIT